MNYPGHIPEIYKKSLQTKKATQNKELRPWRYAFNWYEFKKKIVFRRPVLSRESPIGLFAQEVNEYIIQKSVINCNL